MKRNLLLVGLCLFAGMGWSQISVDIAPYSSVHEHYNFDRGLDHVQLPQLDMARVQAEDTEGKDGSLYLVSRYQSVGVNLENGGTWYDVPGGKVWRLKITSDQAKATSLIFDDFHLPEDAIMHVYSSDRAHVIGAFTSANNKAHNGFATELIKGESCILEYFEPDHVARQGRISVEKIAHYYRGVDEFLPQNERGSDPCQVDVRCSEGDNWGPQIDATVRIVVQSSQGSGFCSGSVMNNTNEDCKPYVLTAYHCGDNSSTANFNSYVFYFNRQRSQCGSGVLEGNNTITGCTRRGHSNDGGGNTGSDWLLVELNQGIPNTYNPYYAGWNNQNTGATSGVSTHHPSGDVKKISTYTSTLSNSGWGIANTHWRVVWSSTANGHGVTEGGSSGSPIWNQNGHCVGQLTGGSSFCTSPNSPDYYGKMSYNWSGNSNPVGGHLKEFPGSCEYECY